MKIPRPCSAKGVFRGRIPKRTYIEAWARVVHTDADTGVVTLNVAANDFSWIASAAMDNCVRKSFLDSNEKVGIRTIGMTALTNEVDDLIAFLKTL